MSLNRLLEIPDGEKSVLFLAEAHDEDSLERTLEVLDTYQPDAIALEMGKDLNAALSVYFTKENITQELLERPFCEEDLRQLGFSTYCSISTAEVYAVKNELPLYYLDWQPFCPLHQQDILSEDPLALPYLEMTRCLRQTIDAFFSYGTSKQILECAPGKDVRRAENYYRQKSLTPEEEKAAIQKYLLSVSDIGIKIRNEYTSMALNALDAKRIAYVCGADHIFPPKRGNKMQRITPLQKLADAPHKYVLDMRTPNRLKQFFGGNIIQRERRTVPLTLDWDLISFYCSECNA